SSTLQLFNSTKCSMVAAPFRTTIIMERCTGCWLFVIGYLFVLSKAPAGCAVSERLMELLA
ncbi:MAG: hypothetical protein WCA08_24410, partial [Desulfoferrobacter sp.]